MSTSGDIESIDIVSMPVKVESELPQSRLELAFDTSDQNAMKSAKGMSGGPIVMVTPETIIPIAVQSTQIKSSLEKHKLFAAGILGYVQSLEATVDLLRRQGFWD